MSVSIGILYALLPYSLHARLDDLFQFWMGRGKSWLNSFPQSNCKFLNPGVVVVDCTRSVEAPQS